MDSVALREYQTTAGVELSPAELATLQATGWHGITVSPSREGAGCYDLTASSRVGSITLAPGRSLIVKPKIPIRNLLFLLSYALDGTHWLDDLSAMAREPDLFEAVAELFLRRIQHATRLGLLQGYVSVDDRLLTVRGRIRFADQLRSRPARLLPIEVTYDEFTEDIAENRLLKAALSRLLRMPLRSPRLRHGLQRIANAFASVRLVEYEPAHLPEVTFTRLNAHYRDPIGLARLILASTSVEVAPGATRVDAFLVDMNQVFEDFVVVALREALRVEASSFPQNAKGRQLYLDADRRVQLKPDLSLWRDGRCRFVGDVKYKRLGDGSMPNPDVYQTLAYCVATGLDHAMIIYGESATGPSVIRIPGVDHQIEIHALDLMLPPEELLTQIRGLARRIQLMTDKE